VAEVTRTWEAARAVLWKVVNDLLREVGARDLLPATEPPAGLAIAEACWRLQEAADRLKGIISPPRGWVWLVWGLDELPLGDADLFVAARMEGLRRVGRHDVHFFNRRGREAPQGVRQTWARREIITPMVDHAEAVRQYLNRLAAVPARPATPTADFCLLNAFFARWKGKVQLQPQLWRVLKFLLHCQDYPVPVGALEEDAWGGGETITSKTLVNTISRLNIALLPVRFPWTWSICEGHVHRDG
jgi:hypothetical protein